MSTTLPTQTRTIDNAFVTTWYDIRPDAIDNILNATVIWAALNNAGCLKPQIGSKFITRTIRYATTPATEIARGDLLPVGEEELETEAIWTWRYLASRVQRNLFDDQENAGPQKIKDLVGMKLDAARDGMVQKNESQILNAIVTGETGKLFQGLHDLVPPIASRTTGTYGGIARPGAYVDSGNGVNIPDTTSTNPWWGPKYLAGTYASIEDDLLADMKKLFNTTSANQSDPNLIISTQELNDIYEEFALDAVQIIKDDATFLADLGFQVLRFKGKPMIWTPNMTAKHMIMLNTGFVEIIYDPNVWFEMTDWKPDGPTGTNRIAHILQCANMVGTQPRRHSRLEYA